MYYVTNVSIVLALTALRNAIENAKEELEKIDVPKIYTVPSDQGLVTETHQIVNLDRPCTYQTFRLTCARVRQDPFMVFPNMNLSQIEKWHGVSKGFWVEVFKSPIAGNRFLDNTGSSPVMATVDQTLNLGSQPDISDDDEDHKVSLDKTEAGFYEYTYTLKSELRTGLCLSDNKFPRRPSDIRLITKQQSIMSDWLNGLLLMVDSSIADARAIIELLPKVNSTLEGPQFLYDQKDLVDDKKIVIDMDLTMLTFGLSTLSQEGDLLMIGSKMALINVLIAEHVDYIRIPLTQRARPFANLKTGDNVGLFKKDDGTLVGVLEKSGTRDQTGIETRLTDETELRVGITPCPVSDRTRLSRPLLTGTARLTALPAHDPTPMVRER